jgi:hypothetical protein
MRQLVYSSLLLILLIGCQKNIKIETTEEKMVDKTWYLEKRTGGYVSLIYSGQPTFSFLLTSSTKSYTDTDGITGNYVIEEQASIRTLQINSSGRQIEAYLIKQIENNYLVMEYTRNNILYTLFFSIRP